MMDGSLTREVSPTATEHGMMVQPGESRRQRLAMKMATGSGKTMAMSLCIAWSYFHALYEDDSPMTTAFAVLAANLIVFERLVTPTLRRRVKALPLIHHVWAWIRTRQIVKPIYPSSVIVIASQP
jgi:hypothetical protein